MSVRRGGEGGVCLSVRRGREGALSVLRDKAGICLSVCLSWGG